MGVAADVVRPQHIGDLSLAGMGFAGSMIRTDAGIRTYQLKEVILDDMSRIEHIPSILNGIVCTSIEEVITESDWPRFFCCPMLDHVW